MNGLDHVREKVEAFRREWLSDAASSLPVDVFTLAELDLGLDIIPIDDMFDKYGMDAALSGDFTGLYIDAEAYQLLEEGPVWKQKRLRFTFAHELGHYVLHRENAAKRTFKTREDFFRWMRDDGPAKYAVEQEANEFAGQLLVPRDKLLQDYDQFTIRAKAIAPYWQTMPDMRRAFADSLSNKYGVNAQVIEMRLDRENVWPTQ